MTGDILAMKPKERKKHDRFNGMSESEVIKRTIPDHLCENLDIVIVSCKFRIDIYAKLVNEGHSITIHMVSMVSKHICTI